MTAMTLKDQIYALAENIAATLPSRKVTLIICCETDKDYVPEMAGFSNASGTGTVVCIRGTASVIEGIMQSAFDTAARPPKASSKAVTDHDSAEDH